MTRKPARQDRSEGLSLSSLASLKLIEKRQWRLWATAGVVTLLLLVGILSFLPSISSSSYLLPQAMWGLLAIVSIFGFYTVYQQLQIHRIRLRLFESEELFRLISENAADMIAVVDAEGNRIYNSLAYEKVLGYSPSELKSSKAFEQIHPDDRERVRIAGIEARRSGVGSTLEYRMRHKDGSWRVLESTASVIRTPTGEPRELVIVNRDITERKKAAESLRQSEAEFRSMVEDAPYGICRCHSTGEMVRANPAFQRMLGFAGPEALEMSAQAFNLSTEFEKLRTRMAEGGEFRDIEVTAKRLDGSQTTLRCTGRRALGGDGVPCFDLFAEDLSERRVLERQLQMAAKMEAIGRLSGGIAHDFNNLLGVIIGYGQLLRRKLEANSLLSEYATEIDKAGQRAAALTRQLLAFSRQQVLTPSVLDLNELVEDMLKMLPRLLGEDIALLTELSEDLGRTKADRNQIEQVLMNLAVNARDAMSGGGTLRITTSNSVLDEAFTRQHPGSRKGSFVMLAVIDSGTGIDAETLAHIFEPFYTTKAVGKGTGLGLATVYGVVKQSEGYIWVSSELGKGTSFEIYLPTVDEPLELPLPPPSMAEKKRGAGTVLVAEDSEPLRKLTRSILESSGFQVLAAANAEEAIDLARRSTEKIDLLLTDVVMPGMDGRALAKLILEENPGIKILYMSGYSDHSVHEGLGSASSLLAKPFTEEQLLKKVCEVLDATTLEPAP